MPLDGTGGSPSDISAQNRERIAQAKKKRAQQLKKWHQYDKQVEKEASKIKKQRLVPPGGKALVDVPDGARAVTFGENIILLDAATRDDHTEVRRLLSKGVSPDLSNEDGLTPLHQCCIDNAINMCRLLLSFGANVNAKDSENWTPLHAAATCGHTELCKLLIDNNADLLALNAEGNMPYDICDHEATLDLIETEMANRGITQQHIDETRTLPEKQMLAEVQKLLLEKPQSLNELDMQGATLLHIAAANGYYEVTQLICSKGASLSIPDKDGWLAIHLAACWGHLDIIELLVSFGADIEVRTKNGSGESVFDICEDGEMQERLRQIKRDAESLRHCSYRNIVRRSSSKNPRSASIRRTSVRDKSLTSWREAKQEAEIRLSKEMELQDLQGNMKTVTANETNTSQEINNDVDIATPLQTVGLTSRRDETNHPRNTVTQQKQQLPHQTSLESKRPRPGGATPGVGQLSNSSNSRLPSMTSMDKQSLEEQHSTKQPSTPHSGEQVSPAASRPPASNKSPGYVNLPSVTPPPSTTPAQSTPSTAGQPQRNTGTLGRNPTAARPGGPSGNSGTLSKSAPPSRNKEMTGRSATPVPSDMAQSANTGNGRMGAFSASQSQTQLLSATSKNSSLSSTPQYNNAVIAPQRQSKRHRNSRCIIL